jgi:hypothetical protein
MPVCVATALNAHHFSNGMDSAEGTTLESSWKFHAPERTKTSLCGILLSDNAGKEKQRDLQHEIAELKAVSCWHFGNLSSEAMLDASAGRYASSPKLWFDSMSKHSAISK